MQAEQLQSQGPVLTEPKVEAPPVAHVQIHTRASRAERLVQASFIWPALLVVLLLSIFPLIISLYLSMTHLSFVPGGFEIRFIGLENYRILLFGSEQNHFLGALKPPSFAGWVVFGAGVALLLWWLASAA